MNNIRSFNDKTPRIAKNVFVDPTAVIIGDVNIAKNSSIWPQTVIRGDINSIIIGEQTNIQDGSVIHVTHASAHNEEGYHTVIGNRITIGHRVILHGCEIHDLVLVGMNSVVMDGAIIESENIIGAGSLIPPGKHLRSGYLWVGSPAIAVRALTVEEKRYLRYSANYYSKLKDQHREQTEKPLETL